MNDLFKISEEAAKQVIKIREDEKIGEEYALRIGVRSSSACGGVSFVIGFDTQADADQVFNVNDIPVLVEKRHMMFLAGLTVDYVDEEDRKGFTFITPQKKKSAKS